MYIYYITVLIIIIALFQFYFNYKIFVFFQELQIRLRYELKKVIIYGTGQLYKYNPDNMSPVYKAAGSVFALK